MSSTRPLSSFRALWIIGRLALRRQLNLWQSVRFGRKKKAPELTSPELRPSAVRSATPEKSTGRSVFSIFLVLIMGVNGFNLASSGLQKLSARVRNITETSDRIRVSPYTEKQLVQADQSMTIVEQISDPTERKKYEDLWNDYLDRLFRDEIQRREVSEEEEAGQLKQMREVFAKKGAAGFAASGTPTLYVSAETWPHDGEARSVFLRVLGAVVLLWIPAMVFWSLGTNNKDLGQVEWSFEWLYTFPVSARALFASKLFDYSFFNPIAWLFFLPFLILTYVAGGRGWMAVPLGLVAFVWVLLLVGSVTTIFEVAMRKFLSLGQLKNMQALSTVFGLVFLLLVFASNISKPLDNILADQAASLRAMTWNPFSLPLYLGVPSVTLREIQLGLWGMIIVAFAGVSTALVGSEWFTREGLVRAGGPYQGTRQVTGGEPKKRWLRGIAAHELLLLARDRNLLVQVLIVPLLVPAYFLLTNSGIVTAVGTSFRHAAMMAFTVGAYSFLNSAMPILHREDKTLWYLLSFPQSLSSILLKKAMVWAGVGLLYGGVVLALVAHFRRHLHGSDWGGVFLALYGIVLYAFIASGIGVLATNVLETTRRARFRTDMVYLYMLLAGMWANTIYSPTVWTRLGQLVLSTLLAFALWQKVKDISPYLMDPTQHPPRTIGLADGMIAALAFFVMQNLIALILHWTVALSWAAQLTISYTLAGLIVGCLTMLILWRQEISGLWEHVGLARAGDGERLPFWRNVVQGAAWGGCAALGAFVYLRVLNFFPEWQHWRQNAEMNSFLARADRSLWICALAILAAPLFEEFLFRGLIFKGLLRSTGPVLATFASAALFALIHPPISVIPVFGLGIAAAVSFRKSGFLLAPIVTHAVYNTCVIFLNKL
jgi:ABC-2 type transport system permease protein